MERTNARLITEAEAAAQSDIQAGSTFGTVCVKHFSDGRHYVTTVASCHTDERSPSKLHQVRKTYNS